MKGFVTATRLIAVVGISLLVMLATVAFAGARINTTKSIPLGLYWVSNQPLEVGAYILFCPPESAVFNEAKKRGYIGSGICPGEYSYLMKKVLAAKNDKIIVNQEGVRVNQKLLPLSAPFAQDGSGRLMPVYSINEYQLNENELLLMSDVSHLSFDARYFGPIQISQIKSVIRPIFTW